MASRIPLLSGNNLELRGRPIKAHYGVRVLRNEGDWKFVEVLFERLDGAMDVAAGDFDGNGRIDLAATAFYPDWRSPVPTTLLLLMQGSDGTVERAGIDDAYWNRWMRISAGDADGDGDTDLLLGAAQVPLAIPSEQLAHYGNLRDKALLLLRIEPYRTRRELGSALASRAVVGAHTVYVVGHRCAMPTHQNHVAVLVWWRGASVAALVGGNQGIAAAMPTTLNTYRRLADHTPCASGATVFVSAFQHVPTGAPVRTRNACAPNRDTCQPMEPQTYFRGFSRKATLLLALASQIEVAILMHLKGGDVAKRFLAKSSGRLRSLTVVD